MTQKVDLDKSIVVVLGHPKPDSFCAALAQAYAEGAKEEGVQVSLLSPSNTDFDIQADPRTKPELEPYLTEAQRLIKESGHVAWVYPLWWGTCPVVLKGFVDRTFRTGYAYRYRDNGFPEGLLKGRSSRILITMGSPAWWHLLIYRNSGISWMKWATLWFSGFKVLKTKQFNMVDKSSPEQREKWLAESKALGRADAARVKEKARPTN